MQIPKLKRSSRSREFDFHDDNIKAECVYYYLFEGKSHRWIDVNVIKLSENDKLGFQAMNILHYVGIRANFKSLFKDSTIEEAIKILQVNQQDFSIIIKMLRYYLMRSNITLVTLENHLKDLSHKVSVSAKDTSVNRKKRLKQANTKAKEKVVMTIVYDRNPDVVAEVLERAKGICEHCKQSAPFVRAKDDTPYLEVHHLQRLADGGEDTIVNAIAVCPNCHRKLHFG